MDVKHNSKKHIQVSGSILDFSDTESIPARSLLPAGLPIGRVISPVKFIKLQSFIRGLYEDRVSSKIEIRDLDELRYATCIVFGDDEGFVAVTPTGEIISLLKSPKSKMKDFMGVAFANAIMVGGNRLDCYNCDNLGPAYCRRGFIPICRIDFDPGLDPKMAQLYGDDCREIVFFLYCGDPVYSYWQKEKDGLYIAFDQYEYIPHIKDIQERLGVPVNGTDYGFAGKFRDMVWGRWNAGLKNDFMFRPDKLMRYIYRKSGEMSNWLKESLP